MPSLQANRSRVVVAAALGAMLLVPLASAEIRYVNKNAGGANNGTSWANAFTDFNSACLAVQPGDEIWAALGTYPVPSNAGFVPAASDVSFFGGFVGGETSVTQRVPGNRTWLTGFHPIRGVVVLTLNDPPPGTIVDGFHFDGTLTSQPHGGGGMIVNGGTVLIRNCHFFDNIAGHAAGIKLNSVHATFEDCFFEENWSQVGDGGGIGAVGTGSLSVTNCDFQSNFCRELLGVIGRGAGIFCDAGYTLKVTDCTFDDNWAYNLGNVLQASGGGIATLAPDSWIENCTFTRNRSSVGGAIYAGAPTTIVNCSIVGNKATEPAAVSPFDTGIGGGIFGVEGLDVTVIHCTIAANWSKHTAGGVHMDGVIRNSIVYGNVAMWEPPDDPEPLIDQQFQGSVDIEFSNVAGLLGGGGPDPQYPGSIEQIPGFVAAPLVSNAGVYTPGDVHLLPTSPCIDAGDNTLVPSGVTLDLDLNPRFAEVLAVPNTGQSGGAGGASIADMGAFEHPGDAPPACYADCDGDASLSIDDFICFQTFFALGDPYSDCDEDGVLSIDDFICFQTFFAIGC